MQPELRPDPSLSSFAPAREVTLPGQSQLGNDSPTQKHECKKKEKPGVLLRTKQIDCYGVTIWNEGKWQNRNCGFKYHRGPRSCNSGDEVLFGIRNLCIVYILCLIWWCTHH